MTQIKIDKGVQIPPQKRNDYRKYPFKELAVGDSFFIEERYATVAPSASAHGRRYGKKFTTRSENGGTRVWRIA